MPQLSCCIFGVRVSFGSGRCADTEAASLRCVVQARRSAHPAHASEAGVRAAARARVFRLWRASFNRR